MRIATFAVAICLWLLGAKAIQAQVTWKTEIVDPGAVSNSYTSLGVGRDGTLHVAYRKSTSAWYAVKRAGAWTTERIPYSTDVSMTVYQIALVLDHDDQPHVAFSMFYDGDDYTPAYVRYAKKTSGTWSVATISGCSIYGEIGGLELALDSRGCPAFVFIATDWCGGDGVKYAYPTGVDCQEWDVENVMPASCLNNQFTASLAFDAFDEPHVCLGCSQVPLQYASRSNAGWSFENIRPGSEGLSRGGSLKFDSRGDPNVVFLSVAGVDVGYSVKRNGAWTSELVDTPGNASPHVESLVLDSQERPHFWYVKWSGSNRDVHYALKRGSQWITSDVDTVNNFRGTASIELDGGGLPWIAYAGVGGVRVASVSTVIERAKTDGVTAISEALELRVLPNPSVHGGVEIVYSGHLAQSVTVRIYDTSGRIVRTLLDGSESGTGGSVAWDGRDSQGRLAAAGAYFVQARSDRGTRTERVIVLR
ncbi:MAG: FlgD immunoglobulin-like domain containing protein [bacterium]